MVTEYLGLSDATMFGNLLDHIHPTTTKSLKHLPGIEQRREFSCRAVSLLSIARNRLRKIQTKVGSPDEVDRHPHPDLKLLTIFMNKVILSRQKSQPPKKKIYRHGPKPAEKPTPIARRAKKPTENAD